VSTGDVLTGRVVVGVSGSLGSLAALRTGLREARLRGRPLVAVLAWQPQGGETVYRMAPTPSLLERWEREAWERLDQALAQAWGRLPLDVQVEPVIVRSSAGGALTAVADRPDDLLVIGTTRRFGPARLLSGVHAYLTARARCPVLTAQGPRPPRALVRRLRRAQPSDFETGAGYGDMAGTAPPT
jgi:nucleotide-binding universal stress UspA family protein